MTQHDGWQSPYDPPQRPNVPPQDQVQPPETPTPPYQQSPYQQQPAPQQPYGPADPYQPVAPYGQAAPYGSAAPYGPATPHQPGAQYPPPAYPAYGYAATPPKNALGIWSLVLGIVSILMLFSCLVGILAAVPALITGYLSRRAQREGLADNGGLALAGIITGWVTVGLTLLVAALLVTLGLAGELD